MLRQLRPILWLVAIALAPATGALAREASPAELIARVTMPPAEREARLQAIAAMDPQQQGAAMVEAVRDRTITYFQPGHGVFVEFTRADGRLFMWYPRNKSVVHGTWGLRDFNGPKLCYKYLASAHGVTGEYEPTECIEPEQKLLEEFVLDSREGDPLGLSAGQIPYRKSSLDVPDMPQTATQPPAAPVEPVGGD